MTDTVQTGLTVYIVEDDAAMRDSLSLMLGLLGFRAVSFASAEAFLDTYRDDWAGCVVCDLKLPGLSGIELQARLREKGSTLPFVIITGHGDIKAARAAFKPGPAVILTGPEGGFRPDEAAAIRAAPNAQAISLGPRILRADTAALAAVAAWMSAVGDWQ